MNLSVRQLSLVTLQVTSHKISATSGSEFSRGLRQLSYACRPRYQVDEFQPLDLERNVSIFLSSNSSIKTKTVKRTIRLFRPRRRCVRPTCIAVFCMTGPVFATGGYDRLEWHSLSLALTQECETGSVVSQSMFVELFF